MYGQTTQQGLRNQTPAGTTMTGTITPMTAEPFHKEPNEGDRETLTLIMNHHRDPLGELVDGLRRQGLTVIESQSIAHSHALALELDPAVVLLNPLVLQPGGIEAQIVERLQERSETPVPVILLVDDPRMMRVARDLKAPLKDFLVKPHGLDEVYQRIELALLTRTKFRALHKQMRDLEGLVATDFKTGLLTDRHFRNVLQVEWKRAQRHGSPLSLMLIDIDEFKQVNDSTEYAFGDEVLRRVAAALKQGIRETDFAARFGGDEFMLLLPHTSPAEAVQTAIRLRRIVGGLLVDNGSYQRRVTVSIGIDTYQGGVLAAGSPTSPEDLRRRANKALHDAKLRGKDRVWLYSEMGGAETFGEADAR